MRHAKSSWKDGSLADHERPLNKRGRRDAPRIGAELADLGWVPDLVVSSDSMRTRETWARMEGHLEARPEVTFTRGLYLAGVSEVGDVLVTVAASIRTVLLLGHNEGWEEVLMHLTGVPERMTTANAALLTGAGETWGDAWKKAPGWRLNHILRPKEL